MPGIAAGGVVSSFIRRDGEVDSVVIRQVVSKVLPFRIHALDAVYGGCNIWRTGGAETCADSGAEAHRHGWGAWRIADGALA